MQSNTKTLKVQRTLKSPYPKVHIQGKWLTTLGFNFGDHVEVTMNKNQIIITKINETRGGI